jgi:cysteine desulfurase
MPLLEEPRMAPLYLDHSAATPMLPEVWEAMRPYALTAGNAASSHRFGRAARQALESAREQITELLDAGAAQVIFTSGATEANNLASFGLAGTAPGTVVGSDLEHPCVVEPLRELARRGFNYLALPVSGAGVAQPPPQGWPGDTRLVCVMLANHETGVLQPVRELAASLGGRAPLHCDAAAAAGKIAISFRRLGVATLAITAHKFHGPPGIGALIVRPGIKLRPQLWGGHQQHGSRPGTEPVALAVGMAAALAWCTRHLEDNLVKVRAVRARFLELLERDATPIAIQGEDAASVPHVVNVAFPGCQADALLMNLDLAGVACSTGSACSSGSLLPSPVLRAMGVADAVLRSAMRFSFSSQTTLAEVEDAAARVASAVRRLRAVT